MKKDIISSEQDIITMIFEKPMTLLFLSKKISSDDFIQKEHRIIYDAMKYLFENNSTIDSISICDYLREENLLNEAGGILYIADLNKDFLQFKRNSYKKTKKNTS